jgi:hypothetical protein
MPVRGVDIIDGIPVSLKDGILYAFQNTSITPSERIQLGTYDTVTKVATWKHTDTMGKWLEEYQTSMAPRSRKAGT